MHLHSHPDLHPVVGCVPVDTSSGLKSAVGSNILGRMAEGDETQWALVCLDGAIFCIRSIMSQYSSQLHPKSVSSGQSLGQSHGQAKGLREVGVILRCLWMIRCWWWVWGAEREKRYLYFLYPKNCSWYSFALGNKLFGNTFQISFSCQIAVALCFFCAFIE